MLTTTATACVIMFVCAYMRMYFLDYYMPLCIYYFLISMIYLYRIVVLSFIQAGSCVFLNNYTKPSLYFQSLQLGQFVSITS